MPDLYLGASAALVTAICWTLSSLIWTAAGKRIGALAVSFIRIALVCFLLVVYGRIASGRWAPTEVSARTWLLLGSSGFFWFFLSDLCLFKAFLLIGTRLALMIMSLTPPLAAILSRFCIGDQLTFTGWMAMSVTLAGITWVLLERPDENSPAEKPPRRAGGILLAVFSATMQAIAIVLSKEGVSGCDPMSATTIAMFGALLGYITLITCLRRWSAMYAAIQQYRTIAFLSVGVLIGPLAGVACNMIALNHAPTGVVATIEATMPVLILPFSATLHHEKIGIRAIGGGLLAVIGVAMLMLG